MMLVLWIVSLAVAFILNGSVSVFGNLNDQLTNYEILKISPINLHRSRRDVDQLRENTLEYNFRALGRNFHLYMQQQRRIEVLLPEFGVYTIDSSGKEKEVDVDLSTFFEGSLVDDPMSRVHANVEGRKLNAWIESRNETYVIEPASTFLRNMTDDEVIVYKDTNLKKRKKNFCGFVHANYSAEDANSTEEAKEVDSENVSKSRTKRAVADSEVLNTCGILLVADYSFYSNVGQSNVATTSRVLIQLIDRVNRIYRPTKFKDSNEKIFDGYGLGIKRIQILTDWDKSSNPLHFNAKREGQWEVKKLLSAFDRGDYSDYCLAHLFTYQRFSCGTLGLAYIASPRVGSPGGICSPKQFCGVNSYCSINTGWTTFQDSTGSPLVTLESHLVTSHELGHNFGSTHDPDTPECSPSPENGGKYLMYQYSVSGNEPNNFRFSPCSRRGIGQVLAAKSSKCFQKRMKSFCGNSRKEEGEECDAGTRGLEGKDKCCSKLCKLKRGASCCPINDACCKPSCQAADKNKLCAHKDATSPCEGEAYCDGVSFVCPLPKPLNDVACGIRGQCQNRTCVPYCQLKGMTPCQCDKIANACKMCCRKSVKGPCEPVTPFIVLKDGYSCVQGMCDKGECKKRISISIERFWQIIRYVDVNEIGKIMWKNIVGTVIILSLIIWIPLSCFISYYDRLKENGKV